MPKVFEAPPGFVLNPDYLVPELRAQRDALLEALKGIVAMWDHHCYAHGDGQPTPLHAKARAAIKAVEEGK